MLRKLAYGCLLPPVVLVLLVASCTLIRGPMDTWASPNVRGSVVDAGTGKPLTGCTVTVANDLVGQLRTKSDEDGNYFVRARIVQEWFELPGDRMIVTTVTTSGESYLPVTHETAHGMGELWTGAPAPDRYIDFRMRADSVGSASERNEWDVERTDG